MVYFTSDWHLSHANIHKFREFASSPEENEALLVEAWEKTIRKQDLVWCLGDMAFDQRGLDVIKNLKGRKKLLIGNHDLEIAKSDLLSVYEEVHAIIRYKKLWLTHCPIHSQELRKCVGNVHGHTHNFDVTKKTWYGKEVLDKRYLNCCVDAIYKDTGSFFYTLDEVKRYFAL